MGYIVHGVAKESNTTKLNNNYSKTAISHLDHILGSGGGKGVRDGEYM